MDVRVWAPTSNSSACSHSVALRGRTPVHVFRDGSAVGLPAAVAAVAVGSTPADAVKMALDMPGLPGGDFERTANGAEPGTAPFESWSPDVVVSGINHGPNFGTMAFYSGTVAAAREASFQGLRSIAASLDGFRKRLPEDFEPAAAILVPLVRRMVAEPAWPRGAVLNINVPCGDEKGAEIQQSAGDSKLRSVGGKPRGLAIVPMGGSGFEAHFVRVDDSIRPPNSEDLRGSDTKSVGEGDWEGGERFVFKARYRAKYEGAPAEDDGVALREGYVTLAPLGLGGGGREVEEAAACLERWRREWEHPGLPWAEL
eukprot:evm.model.scf_889EXC.3 EVM.evm.TU.scf_889EXC.3   scf_889EXC:15150-17250(-)